MDDFGGEKRRSGEKELVGSVIDEEDCGRDLKKGRKGSLVCNGGNQSLERERNSKGKAKNEMK